MTHRVSDDASLVRLALDALYERDERGRMLHPRNPRLAAPRVHFTRTTTTNTWCFSATLPGDLGERIEPLLAGEPVQADPARWEQAEPACLPAVRTILAEHQEVRREYRGPAFRFPDDLPSFAQPLAPVQVLHEPSTVRAASPLEWVAEASESDQPLVVARDAGGTVVSQCHSARRSPRAAHAGVETAPEARRRALGVAVVARWASEVRRLGLEPFYGTWWENEASRALAARLGLVMFAEDWHVD